MSISPYPFNSLGMEFVCFYVSKDVYPNIKNILDAMEAEYRIVMGNVTSDRIYIETKPKVYKFLHRWFSHGME